MRRFELALGEIAQLGEGEVERICGKGDLLPEEVATVNDLTRVREEDRVVADAVELGRHHALDVLESRLDRSDQLRDAAKGVDLL